MTALAVTVGMLAPGQVAVGARPGAGPAGAAPAVQWGPCAAEVSAGISPEDPGTYSCATYQVPLDHRRPSRGTIGLAMLRRAAEGPGPRIGALFLNPGGPGGSGYQMPIHLAGMLPAEIRRRFDLIGFDPRGVGRSAPLRCFSTQEEANDVRGRMLSVPITRDEIRTTVRAHRHYAEACARNAGPLLAHMSTLEVAQDLDLMRQAMGERRLNYLGISYGTLLGATYLNLYPRRVRAIVLDGNVDPALRTTNGPEYLRQRAAGQEAVLDAFLVRCAEVGERCAFSAGNPRARFAEIRERLRRGPVNVPELGGDITLSMFTDAVARYLYAAESYAELAIVLQMLYQTIQPGAAWPGGTAARSRMDFGRKAAEGGLTDRRVDAPYTGYDAGLGVNCADEPFPHSPGTLVQAAKVWERQSPTFGRVHAFSQVACTTWPVAHPTRYSGPWNRRTDNPVLLFGNRHDPATSHVFSTRMAAQLGSARLVSVDAFGHGSLGGGFCADAIAARYLVDLVVPAAGTTCQPHNQPFE